jgi:hypothetical protein
MLLFTTCSLSTMHCACRAVPCRPSGWWTTSAQTLTRRSRCEQEQQLHMHSCSALKWFNLWSRLQLSVKQPHSRVGSSSCANMHPRWWVGRMRAAQVLLLLGCFTAAHNTFADHLLLPCYPGILCACSALTWSLASRLLWFSGCVSMRTQTPCALAWVSAQQQPSKHWCASSAACKHRTVKPMLTSCRVCVHGLGHCQSCTSTESIQLPTRSGTCIAVKHTCSGSRGTAISQYHHTCLCIGFAACI